MDAATYTHPPKLILARGPNSGWSRVTPFAVELSILNARMSPPSVTLGQTPVLQQRANVRRAAVEVLEELIRIRAAAARQHLRA